jgi:hypothetical protein
VADPLTGLVVHPGPFGPGCAQLGNLFQASSDDEAFDLLDAAWGAGVRWFVRCIRLWPGHVGPPHRPHRSDRRHQAGRYGAPDIHLALELAEGKPNREWYDDVVGFWASSRGARVLREVVNVVAVTGRQRCGASLRGLTPGDPWADYVVVAGPA